MSQVTENAQEHVTGARCPRTFTCGCRSQLQLWVLRFSSPGSVNFGYYFEIRKADPSGRTCVLDSGKRKAEEAVVASEGNTAFENNMCSVCAEGQAATHERLAAVS